MDRKGTRRRRKRKSSGYKLSKKDVNKNAYPTDGDSCRSLKSDEPEPDSNTEMNKERKEIRKKSGSERKDSHEAINMRISEKKSQKSEKKGKGSEKTSQSSSETLQFEIQWITPNAPSNQNVYMLEKMPFRMGLIVDENRNTFEPEEFECQLWTNLYHQEYNEGDWHHVTLTYQNIKTKLDDGKVIYLFGADVLPTCVGDYSFTYRAKHASQKDEKTKWARGYLIDGQVTVQLPVKFQNLWIQEPDMQRVTTNIYLGNYQAALIAPDHGFDCVLNMSDDAPVFPMTFNKPIIYRRCPLAAGADKEISEMDICHSVNWLRAMSERCVKILVMSRLGYGRAGSVLVAFVFAFNKNLSFQEAMAFVTLRRFVYNHRGLRDSLYRMFPRE